MTEAVLHCRHNRTAGFFSNCSVRLAQITKFVMEKGVPPKIVDCRDQFRNYKVDANDSEDLTQFFFEAPNVQQSLPNYRFAVSAQFCRYREIDFQNASPYIKAFFAPSRAVREIVQFLEDRYSIDHSNTCSVYYRGNDKSIETDISSYEGFFIKASQLLHRIPDIKFLVQTDELEFSLEFRERFPNSFLVNELEMISANSGKGVHHSIPRDKRREHATYMLAVVLMMSKMRHLILSSGNCALWSILYRGNADNVDQFIGDIKRQNGVIVPRFGWIP